MNVVGRGAAWLARRRLRAMLANAAQPGPAQQALLGRIVAAAGATQFGRDHRLAGVTRVEDLAAAVPLRDYAAMQPWWQRAREGEPGVIWPGVVRHWALSSGTTSGEKFLPVSAATIASNRRGGFDALVPHLARHGGGLFGGKLLFLGGCTQLREQGPVLVGDNTGIMALHVPRWLRRWHVPGPEVRALPDWEEKVRRSAHDAVDCDLRLLAGVPSWILLWGEAALAAARQRGRSPRTLRELWPGLALFVHGGVDFAPYRERARELLGDGVECTDTYSASEGGMLAVQVGDEAGMVPLLDRGAVFEFVPVGELASRRPHRVPAAGVEPGVEYAVALTTDSGIVSYLVGDTVEFTSVRPLRLRFAGRLAHSLNAFGEHISGGELDRAVATAAAATGSTVVEYAVDVVMPTGAALDGMHRFLVEFARPPSDLPAFAAAVDDTLRAGNEDYTTHRSFGLRAPAVLALPEGTFLRWMRARGKVGGQHKVPRVLRAEQSAALLGAG